MSTTTSKPSEIETLEVEIQEKQTRLEELKRQQPPEPVRDYELRGAGGKTVGLSELFGGKPDLIMIHNMGRSCPYCTLWADGFNGLVDHLRDRAGFVVVSPDPPEVQQEFARSRGWRFDMVSGAGSSFIEDMGFRGPHPDGKTGWLPGISTFRRTAPAAGNGSGIERVASAPFGPGDPFCAAWHLFGLLAGGTAGWEPKVRYP